MEGSGKELWGIDDKYPKWILIICSSDEELLTSSKRHDSVSFVIAVFFFLSSFVYMLLRLCSFLYMYMLMIL